MRKIARRPKPEPSRKTEIRYRSRFRMSKRNYVVHYNETEDTTHKIARHRYYEKVALNDNKLNRKKMARIDVSVQDRVKAVYADTSEAVLSALKPFFVFTLLSIGVSTAHFFISGGTAFASALSVTLLVLGMLLALYTANAISLTGSEVSIREALRTKRFWIFTGSVALFYGILFLMPSIASNSITLGWKSIFDTVDFQPEKYGFMPLDVLAYLSSLMFTLIAFRKLFILMPDTFSTGRIDFKRTWKLTNVGFWRNIGFWLTMIAITAPFGAVAYGLSLVRSTDLAVQLLTSAMLFLVCAIQLIIYSAAAAVYYKELVD